MRNTSELLVHEKASYRHSPGQHVQYFQTKPEWHLWGIMGGFIWCTGTVFNFVASHAEMVGPAVSYAVGQGATLVSAAWGVFIWKEFASAPPASRKLVPVIFIFFLLGLGSIAIAPMVTK